MKYISTLRNPFPKEMRHEDENGTTFEGADEAAHHFIRKIERDERSGFYHLGPEDELFHNEIQNGAASEEILLRYAEIGAALDLVWLAEQDPTVEPGAAGALLPVPYSYFHRFLEDVAMARFNGSPYSVELLEALRTIEGIYFRLEQPNRLELFSEPLAFEETEIRKWVSDYVEKAAR